MNFIRSIAKLCAKNVASWYLFLVLFCAFHAVYYTVVTHLPELWSDFKEVWADRVGLRRDAQNFK